MKREDIIMLRPAAAPAADLACDFTIANEMARDGLREQMLAARVGAPRRIDGGVEVSFKPEGRDAVVRYIELESQCCAFLTLAAREADGEVVLSVTGRPDALPVIESIFGLAAQPHA